jgi:hypothetical protein
MLTACAAGFLVRKWTDVARAGQQVSRSRRCGHVHLRKTAGTGLLGDPITAYDKPGFTQPLRCRRRQERQQVLHGFATGQQHARGSWQVLYSVDVTLIQPRRCPAIDMHLAQQSTAGGQLFLQQSTPIRRSDQGNTAALQLLQRWQFQQPLAVLPCRRSLGTDAKATQCTCRALPDSDNGCPCRKRRQPGRIAHRGRAGEDQHLVALRLLPWRAGRFGIGGAQREPRQQQRYAAECANPPRQRCARANRARNHDRLAAQGAAVLWRLRTHARFRRDRVKR